jgi:chemotaxis protein MotB
MARKRYDESTESHERWLISYADFVTLLFAFFVVMYSISVVNEGKYRVFSNALGDAFGAHGPVADSTDPIAPVTSLSGLAARRRGEALRREKERLTKLAKDLSATMAALVKDGKVRVTQNSRGVSVEISESVLFDSGTAVLTPRSQIVLRELAEFLRTHPNTVQVEGHTDPTPIRTAQFASNWELSAVRASSVVRLFVESGVAPASLSVVGRGSTMPLASNDDPVGRARNRRVEVVLPSAPLDPTIEIPTK